MLYKNVYVARLVYQMDTHFVPSICEVPGMFETYYDAKYAAEIARKQFDYVSPFTGNVCNDWEIQITNTFAPADQI